MNPRGPASSFRPRCRRRGSSSSSSAASSAPPRCASPPLELDAYSKGSMVQLAEGASQDVESLGDHVKGAFGASWKEELCEGKLIEGSVDAGSPTLLVISPTALRSLELLRGLKMFTKECRPVKLFAKHLKVEQDQEIN